MEATAPPSAPRRSGATPPEYRSRPRISASLARASWRNGTTSATKVSRMNRAQQGASWIMIDAIRFRPYQRYCLVAGPPQERVVHQMSVCSLGALPVARRRTDALPLIGRRGRGFVPRQESLAVRRTRMPTCGGGSSTSCSKPGFPYDAAMAATSPSVLVSSALKPNRPNRSTLSRRAGVPRHRVTHRSARRKCRRIPPARSACCAAAGCRGPAALRSGAARPESLMLRSTGRNSSGLPKPGG